MQNVVLHCRLVLVIKVFRKFLRRSLFLIKLLPLPSFISIFELNFNTGILTKVAIIQRLLVVTYFICSTEWPELPFTDEKIWRKQLLEGALKYRKNIWKIVKFLFNESCGRTCNFAEIELFHRYFSRILPWF